MTRLYKNQIDLGFSFNFKYMNTHPETLNALPPLGLKILRVSFYILLLEQTVMNDITASESFYPVLNYSHVN